LSILIQNENRKIPAVKIQRFVANPISASESEKNINEINKGIRLSNLEISQPEIGRPIRELTGMVSNKLPNCASLSSYKILMEGILEAQVAKPKPAIKKYKLNDTRCLLLISIKAYRLIYDQN